MKRVFPLALLSILALFAAGCGGGAKQAPATTSVRGPGYRYLVPVGTPRRDVAVTVFRLRKPYHASQFPAAARVMDGIAAKLGGTGGETVTVAGRKARAYALPGGKRIGFVLVGRREYQLYCTSAASGACSLLFDSFATVG